MKTALIRVALLGLAATLGLVGCSSDSPSSNPAPTVVPDSWSIDNLTVTDSSPYLGTAVLVTAAVSRNGSPAPDGTVVEFSSNGFLFGTLTGDLSAGVTEAQITTENGSAQVFLVSNPNVGAGTYSVQAKVRSVVRQLTLTYRERPIDDSLQIYQPLLPNEGSYEGGEQVFLNGKGIVAPVEVELVVQGTPYQAVVENVVESVPRSATGTITIRTPYISNVDRTQPSSASVVVRVGVTTAPEQETLPGAFTFLAEPAFIIYHPLDPMSGTYRGGTLVTIRGRAIEAPAEVTFTVEGVDYDARVVSVIESQPPTADGQIVVETPFLSAVTPAPNEQWPANVSVTIAADTPGAQTETLPSSFIFTSDGATLEPQWTRLDPLAFYIANPDFGPAAGGNTITLLGRGFRAHLLDVDGVTVIDTAPAIDEVFFGGNEAQVVSISADGTQAEVVVPRYQTAPLEQDVPVQISISVVTPENPDDTDTVSRPDAYVYLADEPQPEIASVSPSAGPLDGGTPVTILGSGFQSPVQVTFGDLTAVDVQLIDDQTLADDDEIRCIAPDYSQQGGTPPLPVDVTVTNMRTGKSATASAAFTYGDNLFISGNSPSFGQRGDIVVVFGSGFEDPLRLFLLVAGDTELEVIRVSGTEITARIPEDVVTCGNLNGQFRVELLESDLEAQGGQYELIGNNPRVLSVEPLFVQEVDTDDDGISDGVTPDEIVVNGQRFAPGAIVEIEQWRIPSVDTTVVDETRIEVDDIPHPAEFNLDWDEVPCLTDVGIPGLQRAATPVDVSVINIPGQCRDTLVGGLVYEPANPECVVASVIQVVPRPVVFPPTPEGSSSQVDVEISNVGAGNMILQSVNRTGAAFQIVSTSVSLPATIVPFDTVTITVEFVPPDDDGALYTGTLGVFHTAGNEGSPLIIPLQGQEAFPIVTLTSNTIDFGTVDTGVPANDSFTIVNSGTEAVTIDAAVTSSAGGRFSSAGLNDHVLAAGASVPVSVTFNSASAGDFTGQVDVTADDPSDIDPQGLPASVSLTATADATPPDIDTSPFPPGGTWVFPQTAAGGCSSVQNLTVSNLGSEDLLLVTQSIAVDAPWPVGTFTIDQAASSPIGPGGSTVLGIQFCPTTDDGLTQSGSITITSNDPDEPSITINLEGPEAP